MSMVPIDVAPLVDEFAVPLTLKRAINPTIDVFGRSIGGESTRIALVGSAHVESSRRVLERLPEADRDRETISVYTRTTLKIQPPDVIGYNGTDYQIAWLSDHAIQGEVHIALAQRIEVTA